MGAQSGFGTPYRRFPAFLAPSNCLKTAKPHCMQAILSLLNRIHQEMDCSPTNSECELALDRGEKATRTLVAAQKTDR